MLTGTFQYQDESERLSIEAAIAFVAEMRQLAQTAPVGRVISVCEGQALDQGRALLRSTLREAVQARIDSAEQKGGRPLLRRRVRGQAPLRAARLSSESAERPGYPRPPPLSRLLNADFHGGE